MEYGLGTLKYSAENRVNNIIIQKNVVCRTITKKRYTCTYYIILTYYIIYK